MALIILPAYTSSESHETDGCVIQLPKRKESSTTDDVSADDQCCNGEETNCQTFTADDKFMLQFQFSNKYSLDGSGQWNKDISTDDWLTLRVNPNIGTTQDINIGDICSRWNVGRIVVDVSTTSIGGVAYNSYEYVQNIEVDMAKFVDLFPEATCFSFTVLINNLQDLTPNVATYDTETFRVDKCNSDIVKLTGYSNNYYDCLGNVFGDLDEDSYFHGTDNLGFELGLSLLGIVEHSEVSLETEITDDDVRAKRESNEIAELRLSPLAYGMIKRIVNIGSQYIFAVDGYTWDKMGSVSRDNPTGLSWNPTFTLERLFCKSNLNCPDF